MASENHVLFEVEDGVGVVTMNRPDRMNAVNWDLASDLVKLFRELRFRDEVRTIVLTGAGGNFCSGGDAEFLSGGGDRPLPGLSEPDRPMERYQRKTPAGPFATRLYQRVGHAADDKSVSVWIAPARHNLPVQVSISQDGVTVEQRLSRYRVGE